LFLPVHVKKCDNCKKEIKKWNEKVVVETLPA